MHMPDPSLCSLLPVPLSLTARAGQAPVPLATLPVSSPSAGPGSPAPGLPRSQWQGAGPRLVPEASSQLRGPPALPPAAASPHSLARQVRGLAGGAGWGGVPHERLLSPTCTHALPAPPFKLGPEGTFFLPELPCSGLWARVLLLLLLQLLPPTGHPEQPRPRSVLRTVGVCHRWLPALLRPCSYRLNASGGH